MPYWDRQRKWGTLAVALTIAVLWKATVVVWTVRADQQWSTTVLPWLLASGLCVRALLRVVRRPTALH